MIIHDVEQGSQEWFEVRMGKPTSSEFGNIITPAKGDVSKSQEPYANKLLGEILQGYPEVHEFISKDMERGKVLEEEAVEQYEFVVGEKTEKIGFITNDEKTYGASPDRMWQNRKGLVEIKCLNLQNHMNFLFQNKIDPKHKPQLQGQMLVTGADFVDWWAYHPHLPPVHVRTERDDAYIAKLEHGLKEFKNLMDRKMQFLIDSGYMENPLTHDVVTGEIV